MTDTTLAALLALTTAALAGPVGLIIRRGQRYGNAVTGVVIGPIVNLPLLIGATILLWEPGWWNLRAVMLFVALGLAGGRTPVENVEIAGLYWHFVDLVWVFIFTFFYLI